MKMLRFIPLLFLTACSTAPKLTLFPQPPLANTDNSTVRYPEVIRAYLGETEEEDAHAGAA